MREPVPVDVRVHLQARARWLRYQGFSPSEAGIQAVRSWLRNWSDARFFVYPGEGTHEGFDVAHADDPTWNGVI